MEQPRAKLYLCRNRKWYIYLSGIIFGLFLLIEAIINFSTSSPLIIFCLIRLTFGALFGIHCIQLWRQKSLPGIYWLWTRIKLRWDNLKYTWLLETPFKVWFVVGLILISISIVLKFPILGICLLVSLWLIGTGLELLNSCVEKLCDLMNPSYSKNVKIIKDAFGSAPAFCHSAFCITWIIILTWTIW